MEQPSMMRRLEDLCYGTDKHASDEDMAHNFEWIAGALGHPKYIEHHELMNLIARSCANIDIWS